MTLDIYSVSEVEGHGTVITMLAWVAGEERRVALHLDDMNDEDRAAFALVAAAWNPCGACGRGVNPDTAWGDCDVCTGHPGSECAAYCSEECYRRGQS